MGERALLVVSFGTSYEETRKRTIDAIEADLQKAFPGRTFYRAWTSKFIIARLKRETGTAPATLDEALAAMAADGACDLLVQPTHMMPAIEYQLVVDAVSAAADRFEHVSMGDALLATDDDCASVAAALDADFPREDGDMVVLMGHGTSNDTGNEVYAKVQACLEARGREDFCIATVEGVPGEDFMLERVDAAAVRTVRLAPFMIVAGDHANNDLAGDEEDSWKSKLKARGYATQPVLKGMGEYADVRALLVEHARQARAVK